MCYVRSSRSCALALLSVPDRHVTQRDVFSASCALTRSRFLIAPILLTLLIGAAATLQKPTNFKAAGQEDADESRPIASEVWRPLRPRHTMRCDHDSRSCHRGCVRVTSLRLGARGGVHGRSPGFRSNARGAPGIVHVTANGLTLSRANPHATE